MDQPPLVNNTSITNNGIIIPFIVLIVFLIIIMVLIMFDVNLFNKFSMSSKSQEQIAQEVSIIIFFSLLVFGLCWLFLPNVKEFKGLFDQISNITYIIVYTIFFILFYTIMSSDILNTYYRLINTFMLGLGSIAFYKGSADNYVEHFNVNYERIKMIILLFCFITLIITFYSVNPGGVATQYFGYSLLLTIIITVFAFLYLIIVMTLSGKEGASSKNVLSNFSSFGKYGSILFILFLVLITIFISYNKTTFFKNKTKSTSVIILILIICILSVVLLGANLFIVTKPNVDMVDMNKTALFKKSLLILFGLVISGLLIFWITYNINGLSGNSSIFRFILNLLMVAVILGLIYKTINVKLPSASGNIQKNAFFNLILNTLLYIPCLVSGLFDWVGKQINGPEESGSWMMLILAIGLIIAYFKTPNVFNLISSQGGTQLVNQPVYTDTIYNLGSYTDLNGGSDKFDYQYAISCWVFLDAVSPSTTINSNKFTSLLNFGNKPNILYESKTNTLMITMQQKDLKNITKNKLTDFDEEGNRIIYINKNFLLQKWNNIIVNYTGGTLDIFLNGELVKSSIEVVPYHTLDNLTVGESNGVKGGICNVVYFRQALTSQNIYYIYNTVKERTPPLLNNTNETILVNIKQI